MLVLSRILYTSLTFYISTGPLRYEQAFNRRLADLSILPWWNEVTKGRNEVVWNEVVMERSDRIPNEVMVNFKPGD